MTGMRDQLESALEAALEALPQAAAEEREFMQAVVAGLLDLEAGREVSAEDARRELGVD